MPVDPPEGRPLNLRDLLDEESPEVLAPALRRFRRRTIIRGAWVATLGLAALLVTPLLRDEPSTLPERYYGSNAVVSVGESVSGGGVTVTVLDGAKLDRTTGALHLIASTSSGDDPSIVAVHVGRSTADRAEIHHPTLGGPAPIAEAFVVVPVGTSEITVSVAVSSSGTLVGTTELTLDLSRSPSLQSLWR